MDSLKEKLYTEGFSEKSVIFIANVRRPGRVSHYELAWRKWDSFCGSRKIDSIRCPMRDEVQFLTECFQEGSK